MRYLIPIAATLGGYYYLHSKYPHPKTGGEFSYGGFGGITEHLIPIAAIAGGLYYLHSRAKHSLSPKTGGEFGACGLDNPLIDPLDIAFGRGRSARRSARRSQGSHGHHHHHHMQQQQQDASGGGSGSGDGGGGGGSYEESDTSYSDPDITNTTVSYGGFRSRWY